MVVVHCGRNDDDDDDFFDEMFEYTHRMTLYRARKKGESSSWSI